MKYHHIKINKETKVFNKAKLYDYICYELFM
jgi:hypothetical protein